MQKVGGGRRVTVENAFNNPVLSHADIIQKLGYCINKFPFYLTLFIYRR